MTIPNQNYKVYKGFQKSINQNQNESHSESEVRENKVYCHKLQDALFHCRMKNLQGLGKEKCSKLHKFIEQIDCYNPYK